MNTCTSHRQKNLLSTEGKSVWKSLLLVASGGGEGCWLPNWKVGGQQERREGAFRVNPTFLPAAVPGSGQSSIPCCAQTWTHRVSQWLCLNWTMVQGCPGAWAVPAHMRWGFSLLILLLFITRSNLFFNIYTKTLKIQILLPLLNDCALTSLFLEASVWVSHEAFTEHGCLVIRQYFIPRLNLCLIGRVLYWFMQPAMVTKRAVIHWHLLGLRFLFTLYNFFLLFPLNTHFFLLFFFLTKK